jgi:hypothetical protein
MLTAAGASLNICGLLSTFAMLVDQDGSAVIVINPQHHEGADEHARAAVDSFRFENTVLGMVGVMIFRDEKTACKVAKDLSTYDSGPKV